MGELAPRNGVGELIDQRVVNRAGFRRRAENGGTEYVVLPEAWRTEVCAGLDAASVAKALAARGHLATGGDGKAQVKTRVPGFASPVRCYVVTAEVMGDTAPPATSYADRRSAPLF